MRDHKRSIDTAWTFQVIQTTALLETLIKSTYNWTVNKSTKSSTTICHEDSRLYTKLPQNRTAFTVTNNSRQTWVAGLGSSRVLDRPSVVETVEYAAGWAKDDKPQTDQSLTVATETDEY